MRYFLSPACPNFRFPLPCLRLLVLLSSCLDTVHTVHYPGFSSSCASHSAANTGRLCGFGDSDSSSPPPPDVYSPFFIHQHLLSFSNAATFDVKQCPLSCFLPAEQEHSISSQPLPTHSAARIINNTVRTYCNYEKVYRSFTPEFLLLAKVRSNGLEWMMARGIEKAHQSPFQCDAK